MVPADYAYVLHTANPVTGAAGQVFGEVVVGMGEALVGNYPGRWAVLGVPDCWGCWVVGPGALAVKVVVWAWGGAGGESGVCIAVGGCAVPCRICHSIPYILFTLQNQLQPNQDARTAVADWVWCFCVQWRTRAHVADAAGAVAAVPPPSCPCSPTHRDALLRAYHRRSPALPHTPHCPIARRALSFTAPLAGGPFTLPACHVHLPPTHTPPPPLTRNRTCRALSFTAPLAGGAPTLMSLPAKRVALKAPPASAGSRLLIARSDANGEDLKDMAGAGLYDRCALGILRGFRLYF